MSARLSHSGFRRLLELLRESGHELIGPTISDGAIVYGPIVSADDLPIGWTDEQAPGKYRLRERGDRAHFGYVVGPQGPRRYLTPPVEPLVRIRLGSRDAAGKPRRAKAIETVEDEGPPLALIGVRSCELAAIEVQDRVWAGGPFVDPRYARRRERALIIAVDCLEPGELCFCVSTNTGPGVEEGFDLRLTELGETFLVEIGSERGRALVEDLGEHAERATAELLEDRARGVLEAAVELRGRDRQLDVRGVPELLFSNLDHPRWNEVAARCLSCGSCTQVCPTCFCHRIEEHAPLDEDTSERVRYWDSCFTDEHSRIHGAQFRPQIRQRYRQWATHKLGAWVSQFGTSGCVGCGRCIAWCPVGIDITEEIAAIRADPKPVEDAKVIALPEPRQHAPLAGDAMLPHLAKVVSVVDELRDVVTLAVEPAGVFQHRPGQFNMIGLPEIGEIPISISGQSGTTILHTIRAVGASSRALTELKAGDALTLRGPFGSAWPLDEAVGNNVVVIAGGLGLAPLRGALREFVDRPDLYPSLRLLYGARSPDDVLFAQEILSWDRSISFAPTAAPVVESGHVKVHVTVDVGAPGWTGHVGVVTKLMRRKPLSPHAVYLVCGPEIMMRFVLRELAKIGVARDRVWLSMERNMKCAVGLCGRCQYGPHFICKDGPVFRWDQIDTLLGREGF